MCDIIRPELVECERESGGRAAISLTRSNQAKILYSRLIV